MKYYLLDYENVNSSGLDGMDELTEDCRIVLFYTRNSNKIDLVLLNMLHDMKAELDIIEVHHGKQALDIQLASYLGYLTGTEPKETEYYIISKDKGYRNVQSFWPDRHIVLCRNLYPDSEIIDEPAPAKKPAAKASRSTGSSGRGRSRSKASADAPKAEPPKPEPPKEEPPKEEPKPNAFAEAAAIARAVVEAKKARNEAEKKEAEAADKPAKKARKTAKKADSKKSTAKKSEAKKTEAKKAESKKTEPKKAESKKSPARKKTVDRNDVNNDIQKTLSKEGFAEDVVNSTASLVAKNYGKEGFRQKIYRSIIKENGQKQGLAIYRLIKDKL